MAADEMPSQEGTRRARIDAYGDGWSRADIAGDERDEALLVLPAGFPRPPYRPFTTLPDRTVCVVLTRTDVSALVQQAPASGDRPHERASRAGLRSLRRLVPHGRTHDGRSRRR